MWTNSETNCVGLSSTNRVTIVTSSISTSVTNSVTNSLTDTVTISVIEVWQKLANQRDEKCDKSVMEFHRSQTYNI